MSIVFKVESKPKHNDKFFWGGFSSKTKNTLFQGYKIVVFKLKFQICFFAFVILCKRKHQADLHKKILIFRPPGIFWKLKLCCASSAHTWQNFHFHKITGTFKINIFIWKFAETFLIHQRTIYKNKIWKKLLFNISFYFLKLKLFLICTTLK